MNSIERDRERESERDRERERERARERERQREKIIFFKYGVGEDFLEFRGPHEWVNRVKATTQLYLQELHEVVADMTE